MHAAGVFANVCLHTFACVHMCVHFHACSVVLAGSSNGVGASLTV